MNPSNPFGSPQGGAFQAPSSTMKTGLFQAFGQQNPTNQSQSMGFFQPPAFGQSSPHGGTVFGQAPAFGQSSTQPSSLPAVSQAPAFGQPSLGMSSSGFGNTATPAFGQANNPPQSSVFGNPPSFGQPSAFGQTPGFGKPPPAYGQQPSGFGNSQMSSGSTTSLGQAQPLPFGQSVFGQPPPGPVITTTSVFGTSQSVTQSRGFGSSKFNFKPANEALFKPIFSASPEPANPQTTSMSSSPFGGSPAQTSTSSTTTTGFPLLTGPKPGSLGFSFSQPAAAPSIPAPNNPLTAAGSSSSSSTLQFTFSQPAAPSSSSTQASSTQPTTPSSFSFSVKAPLPETTPIFGGTNFVQPSAFGDNKAKVESSADEKGSNLESLEETNVFARLSKGTKRKEEPPVLSAGSEKLPTEGDASAETDASSHPSKRPLVRLRGGLRGGLFGRALGDLRRGGPSATRRETAQETRPQPLAWTETEGEDVPAPAEDLPPPPAAGQTLSRELLEKAGESGSASDLTPETKTPLKQVVRRLSSESLSGALPPDGTVLQCRNIPPALNKMDELQKHFSRFGKVRKVTCRPAKSMAVVHFEDHASALRAKKKGRILHKHELLLLWQRKKQSPGDKGRRPTIEAEEAEGQSESQEAEKPPAVSSPLKRPAARASPAFTIGSPLKKSPLVKALHFETEPQKEGSTEAPVPERSMPSSLLPLIDQVAETAEDKYRLLEQRDKILRQGRPKRLDMSKVFVGTCPDMCPEKERYMRETRKQLSMFEVISETEMVNHTAAIKEYSRSSADQEEPLPHELRPLPVLSMTMNYLVTQIMDQGHENRDWYDFVWNRTRGIRKDITQQRLCCPQTVALIEKCTRFHVHCGHHLCEEHVSAFDAKINNENMTKCLQSLKEMYQDLAMHQTFCAQEAEFRQYSVLLKLNDGDILREVQQFRDEVRNSPEVKFAVQAFAAVNNNNFVRFFKLVKGASYLASCLLHRYFNQVRAMALKTLNWAHTVGPRSIPFPLEDISRMLMFHNTAEAADFIQQYGLVVNDDVVELSRSTYQEPDLPQSQKKSDIILAKKTMLVGEVVNGGPLPQPPQHTPICSFDSQNKYRGEVPAEPPPAFRVAVKAELKVPPIIEPLMQVKVPEPAAMFALPPAATAETGEPQLFQPIAAPQPVKPASPPPKPQPVFSTEDVTAVLDAVIEEVVEAAVREVADAGASYAVTALAESSVQAGTLVDEVLGQMLKEMSSAEIQLERERVAEEKRKLEEARRKQEHETFLQQFSSSLCTELVHEVLDETIKETAASEIQLAVNEKADRVAKCTEEVCSSLVQETVNADVALLVAEILEAELQRIHKYIKRWRDVVAVRRQLKRQMRGFPAAPCCVDPRFKLRALAPSAPPQPSMADLARGLVNLGNAGTLSLSSTRLLKLRQEVIHQMRVHHFYQQLLDESAWAPLDLPALVTEHMVDPPERIFWKAVLLLPSDHETGASLADRILSDWLEAKLGGGGGGGMDSESSRQQQVDGTLQTLCVSSTVREKEKQLHRVHLSVKVSHGPLTEDGLSKMEECCELQGAGALISLLPALPVLDPDQDGQDVPLLSALLQLKQLQQASSWHSPLPLVVLVPGPDGDTHKLEQALMLHTLVNDGLISEYTFLFIPETTSDLQGSKQLVQAVQWLLARAPPPFPLSCRTLVHLVEAALSREFSSRVSAHRQERAAADLPSEEPGPVIQLYNSVLAHVADAVSSQDLCKLSWPPAEFCQPETRDFVPHQSWNSEEHLAWLRDSVLSLQLPPWEQVSDADSWSELCSSVFGYAAQISLSRRSQPLLMSRLENLLQRVRHQIRRARVPRSRLSQSSWSHTEEDVSPGFTRIPWDDMLVICIDHKLKDWQVPSAPVCEDAVTEHGEILVYFPAESLKGFQPAEEWTRAVARTHRQKQEKRDGAAAAACSAPPTPALRQQLFPSLLEPQEAQTAPLDITHTPSPQELLVYRVLQGLEEEKAESRRSMERFQRWLDGDPVEDLSTPLFLPSSTLLSMPTTVRRTPPARTRDEAVAQEPEAAEDPSEPRPRAASASLSWRLKELQRQIVASQEEEMACRLKLSGLLSIVED
ncbi:uncharacterized protein V6R79_007728 [Siganus canaliculatus]